MITPLVAASATADKPCQSPESDPADWFPETSERARRAQAACQTCPMMQACLNDAIERGMPIGIWGGSLLQNGQVVPVSVLDQVSLLDLTDEDLDTRAVTTPVVKVRKTYTRRPAAPTQGDLFAA